MQSTGGKYFQALDHVRALAAFLVFVWHFNHVQGGQLESPLFFGSSLFTEGHTGVAVFMTLSGYLFARLIGDRDIIYSAFLWNRFIRLVPLLVIVFAMVAIENAILGRSNAEYIIRLASGFVFPVWPNGGWSIAAEIHFYLILPLLLFVARKSTVAILGVLLLSVGLRTALWFYFDSVQHLSYFTIVGRIDQFAIGIFFGRLAHERTPPAWVAGLVAVAFLAFWHWFDSSGGFYADGIGQSSSAVWIAIPLVEGFAFGTLIKWYDATYRDSDAWPARFVARIGAYSYSIYLLHFFIVFRLSALIDSRIVVLENGYLALVFAIPAFLLMIPLAWASFTFVESPILRFRRNYVRRVDNPSTR